MFEETFSSDELVELGRALEQVKDDAGRALPILKVLGSKKVTAELLIDTKIGKKLTMVKDDFPNDVEYS